MSDHTDEQYAKFEASLQQLALDTFGIRLTDWHLIYLALDEDMRVVENTVMPEAQTLQTSAGLLRWATVNCDHAMIQALRDDDD